MSRRILFVTWDGPQVSYLESLFLPIFARLQHHGFRFDVLQFRWGDRRQADAAAQTCGDHGIGYRAVFTRRWPAGIGPFASAVAGARHVREAVTRFDSDVLMPRSLMPALGVLAACGSGLRPILFDADGLEADERVEFRGLARQGPTYRLLRAVEARIVRQSSSVLVRSEFAASLLSERSGVPRTLFHVVTNGRDGALFKPGSEASRRSARQELGIAVDAPLIVYAGSAGLQYRFDLVAETAAAVRSRLPNTRLLVLTGAPHEARTLLASFNPGVLGMAEIRSASPDAVPRLIATADLALGFRAKTLSMRAVSPVKTGEYLLCGVPIFGTAGIGDTAPAELAGVFKDEAIGSEAVAAWLETEILTKRNRFRSTARKIGVDRFSLDRSVTEYLEAIEPLSGRARGTAA